MARRYLKGIQAVILLSLSVAGEGSCTGAGLGASSRTAAVRSVHLVLASLLSQSLQDFQAHTKFCSRPAANDHVTYISEYCEMHSVVSIPSSHAS